MKNLIISAIVLLSQSAIAYEFIDKPILDDQKVLLAGQMISIPLDGRVHFIKKLIIAAYGVQREALFEVVVNGTVKGTIHVPGNDPQYVVTIAEATKSVELHHVSGSNVRVQSILATLSKESLPDTGSGGGNEIELPNPNTISDAALHLVRLSRSLSGLVSPTDNNDYIIPLKSSSGRMYAISAGHGSISAQTRQAIQAVIWQIEVSNNFWNQCLQNDPTFDLTVEILAIKERLKTLIY